MSEAPEIIPPQLPTIAQTDVTASVSSSPIQTPFSVPDPSVVTHSAPVTTQGHRLVTGSRLEYFKLIAQWEGRVESTGDVVSAMVRNLTDLSEPEMIMEFSISEFEETERTEVAPGSLFYLNVGYEIRHGTQRQSSFFKLKRLVPMRTRRSTELPASFFED